MSLFADADTSEWGMGTFGSIPDKFHMDGHFFIVGAIAVVGNKVHYRLLGCACVEAEAQAIFNIQKFKPSIRCCISRVEL